MQERSSARVSKRVFLARVADRADAPMKVVRAVYAAIFEEILEAVAADEIVVLTGIGRFYRQDHKGHKVRFGREYIDDYSVLKFSASRSTKRTLGAEWADEDTDEDDEDLECERKLTAV